MEYYSYFIVWIKEKFDSMIMLVLAVSQAKKKKPNDWQILSNISSTAGFLSLSKYGCTSVSWNAVYDT